MIVYIYLHEWLNFMVNVGKYTIHYMEDTGILHSDCLFWGLWLLGTLVLATKGTRNGNLTARTWKLTFLKGIRIVFQSSGTWICLTLRIQDSPEISWWWDWNPEKYHSFGKGERILRVRWFFTNSAIVVITIFHNHGWDLGNTFLPSTSGKSEGIIPD